MATRPAHPRVLPKAATPGGEHRQSLLQVRRVVVAELQGTTVAESRAIVARTPSAPESDAPPPRRWGRADDPERSRDRTARPAAGRPGRPAGLCSGYRASAETSPPTANEPPGRSPPHWVRPLEQSISRTTSCNRFAGSVGKFSRRESTIVTQSFRGPRSRKKTLDLGFSTQYVTI